MFPRASTMPLQTLIYAVVSFQRLYTQLCPFKSLTLRHPAPSAENPKLPGVLLNTLYLHFAPPSRCIFSRVLDGFSCMMSHFEDKKEY